MAQSFHFIDTQQHCSLDRRDISGGKFSLFTELHIHVESVNSPFTEFVELFSKASVFLGICCLRTTSLFNKTMVLSTGECSEA
jgi:hypothetical protein